MNEVRMCHYRVHKSQAIVSVLQEIHPLHTGQLAPLAFILATSDLCPCFPSRFFPSVFHTKTHTHFSLAHRCQTPVIDLITLILGDK